MIRVCAMPLSGQQETQAVQPQGRGIV